MSYLALFALVFVGGPLAFHGLMRHRPSPLAFRRLAVLVVLCAVAGLTLRYGLADLWGRELFLTGLGIVFFWGGWIGILAYGAQALRQADTGLKMRRWTAVVGAVGTTVPWFGLASADLMMG